MERTARRAAERADQTASELERRDIIHGVKPCLALDVMHEYRVEPVGDDQHEFFYTVHSRTLNTLNKSYLLPVDQDEVKVFPA